MTLSKSINYYTILNKETDLLVIVDIYTSMNMLGPGFKPATNLIYMGNKNGHLLLDNWAINLCYVCFVWQSYLIHPWSNLSKLLSIHYNVRWKNAILTVKTVYSLLLDNLIHLILQNRRSYQSLQISLNPHVPELFPTITGLHIETKTHCRFSSEEYNDLEESWAQSVAELQISSSPMTEVNCQKL